MKKLLLVLFTVVLFFSFASCISEDEEKTKIDENIDLFLEKYAKDYLDVKNNKVDFHVVEGLRLLEKHYNDYKLVDYMSKDEATEYTNSLDYNTPTNIFKASVIDNAYNMETEKAINQLKQLTTVDNWSITYLYKACDFYNVNDTLKNDLEARLNVIKEEDYRDADYAGMALVVSHNAKIDKTPLFNLIKSSISNEGIVSWGSANACSTSYAIFGLLASGVNIDKEYIAENGNTLVDNLLAFAVDGAFSNYLGQDADLDYATPQGFLALVSYKVFKKTLGKVVIFS